MISKDWKNESGEKNETKLSKKGAIIGFIAAALLSTSAKGSKPIVIDSDLNGKSVAGDRIVDDSDWKTAESTETEQNEIIVRSGAKVQYVIGAQSTTEDVEVKDNAVQIEDGEVADSAYGGRSTQGAANANSVAISGGKTDAVIGGEGKKEANDNTVLVTGGEVGSLTGGSGQGHVTGNKVIVKGNYDIAKVYGGYSSGGNADNNDVSLEGDVNVSGNLYGGYATGGSANGNSVDVKGPLTVGALLVGGYAKGDANDNRVTVDGLDGRNSIAGNLMGGRSAEGDALRNTVDIKGNFNIGASVYGGYAPKGNAEENTISLEGDMDLAVKLYGGYASDGNVRNNHISLKGDISLSSGLYAGITESGEASGNSVSLEGNIRIGGELRGGYSFSGLSADNTLEIKSERISVGALYNFQNLNFYFSDTIKNNAVMLNVDTKADIRGSKIQIFLAGDQNPLQVGDKVILISTRDGITGDPIDNGNSQIKARLGVSLDYGSFELSYDKDNKKLIASVPDPTPDPEPAPEPDPTPDPDPNPTPDPNPNPDPAPMPTPDPDPGVTPDPNPTPEPAPMPTPDPKPDNPKDPSEKPEPAPIPEPEPAPGVTVNPQMKVFSEGFLAGMTQLQRAGDLLAGSASAAMEEALSLDGGKSGWMPFVVGGGNSMTHKTGSTIRTEGTALLAGLAAETESKTGVRVLGGVFLERGDGDYSTHNTFANAAAIRGKGNSDYLGAGVMGRIHFPSRTDSHTYFEGALRSGRIRINYDSLTLTDALGQVAAFHTKSSYKSAHASIGRVMELTDRTSLDLRADYLWTRMSSADVRLTTGDPVRFEAVNSHRVKVGGRLTMDGDLFKPYVGLAYEHEFDGTARATTNGYKIAAPSLKGGTVIGEMGIRVTPEKTPLTVDLGIQMHGGKREGVTGSVRFTYRF